MKNQFVDYKTATDLKELMFDEKVLAYYLETKAFYFFESESEIYPTGKKYSEVNRALICAPIWQQVKEWLWDKHKIQINVHNFSKIHKGDYVYNFSYEIVNNGVTNGIENGLEDRFMGSTNFVESNKKILDSPITAEKEGIKNAVNYVSKRITLRKM